MGITSVGSSISVADMLQVSGQATNILNGDDTPLLAQQERHDAPPQAEAMYSFLQQYAGPTPPPGYGEFDQRA